MIFNNDNQEKNLHDELYCQHYELNAMADLLIRKETERWVSGFANLAVEIEHHSRYVWISNYVKNKRVLDIACGSGKGTFTLANKGLAKEVIGCDLDDNAIKYANIRYRHQNAKYICQDAMKFSDIIKYDTIVSFETIEHIPDVHKFLNGINELLVNDGYFYVSTPISRKPIDTNPENPYHVQEWNLIEFKKLISEYFIVEETFLQMREEKFPLIYYWVIFKMKIEQIFNFKKIKKFKKKFLGNNSMKPIKISDSEIGLFRNYYGIVGLQILVCKKK
jgi:2-polyprenyl-3-methyl-5-hydroxy-6-metoxy-1,4-benzoquinol methylase